MQLCQVGAILVRNGRALNEFSELADPSIAIPLEVTHLTGITNEMVSGKRPPKDVVSSLKEFIGDRPVVAHNAYGFDAYFLDKYGFRPKQLYDLMDFSFFVMPSLEGHSVSYLAKYFNLGEEPHRALGDCQIEFEIFNILSSTFAKKPKRVKTSMKYLASSYGWWWNEYLPAEEVPFDSFISIMPAHEKYRKDTSSQEAFDMATQKLSRDEVDQYFLPKNNPDTEYAEDRPDQRNMSWAIADSFNERKHAAIEAGTGIGKSKGYLVPSALFAIKNSIPVVITTYTKVLQDQLFTKEIPHIKSLVKKDLQVALIKGKTNYVCLSKVDELYHETAGHRLDQQKNYSLTKEGAKYDRPVSLLLVAAWIFETQRGDWDDLPFWLQNRMPKSIEEDLCNHDESCAKGMCDGYDESKCFLAKAKLRAKDADIVIINHAVLLTGIIKKEIKPEDDLADHPHFTYSHSILSNESKYLVIDEAHFLEDAATSSWEAGVTTSSFSFATGLIYGRRGIYKNLAYLIQNCPNNQSELERLLDKFQQLENKIQSLLYVFRDPSLANFVGLQSSNYAINKIIDNEVRSLQDWSNITQNLSDMRESLLSAVNTIKKITDILSNNNADEKQTSKIARRAEIVARLAENINTYLTEDNFYVRYIELNLGEIKFLASPISVATLLKEAVYDNFGSVCLVSATMKVDRDFSFFAERCGLNLLARSEISYLSYKSTFDFKNNMKFLIPREIDYKASGSAFLSNTLPFILSATLASHGGSLVLCSSHAQVKEIATYLYEPLSRNGITLFQQDKKRSANAVVRSFRDDIDSVLIGTTSLWHGVDVPGPSLRSLIILKIPYKSPSNPVFSARCKAIEATGKQPFYTYSQPLACIDLRQGIGRLIRKKTDNGVVVCLDDRLLQSRLLCSALPDEVEIIRTEQDKIFEKLNKLRRTIPTKTSEVLS